MAPDRPLPDPADPPWLEAEQRLAWMSLVGVAIRLLPTLDSQLERDADLTFFEYMVLAMLSEQPEGQLRMSELASVANASLSRLSHVAKKLERAGLLQRSADATDARATIATITPAGRERVGSAAPGHARFVRDLVFGGLSPAQVGQLRRISDAILERLAPGASGEPFASRHPGASRSRRSG